MISAFLLRRSGVEAIENDWLNVAVQAYEAGRGHTAKTCAIAATFLHSLVLRRPVPRSHESNRNIINTTKLDRVFDRRNSGDQYFLSQR
jgi:hypothetical protein